MKSEIKRYEQAKANETAARAELDRVRRVRDRASRREQVLNARLFAYKTETEQCKQALIDAAEKA